MYNYTLIEIENSVSSLSYTLFGLFGLFIRYNTNLYYLLMNLLIILGISSCIHHYDKTLPWAHAADIISIELIVPFSLLYTSQENKYCLSLILICCVVMLIFNISNFSNWSNTSNYRNNILHFLMINIVLSQIYICYYFIKIKSKLRNYILLTSLWNLILFSTSCILWEMDRKSPDYIKHSLWPSMWHSMWHIGTGLSLLNVISVSNIYRCTINYLKFNFICKKLICIISPSKQKINVKDSETNTNTVTLLKGHRRTNTIS